MNPIVLASGLGKIDAIALHISDVAARADPGLLIPAFGASWDQGRDRALTEGGTFPAAIPQHPTRGKLGID